MAEVNIDCLGEKSSDEVFDYECGPCKFDGNILKANGFCSDCSDYLCDDCFRTHRKPVPSRHHILLNANEMPKDKTAVKQKDVSTIRCKQHEGSLIEYYCSNHEYLGCGICMTLDHRACEKVKHIPKIVEGLYTSQEYVDFKHNIDAVVQKTESNEVQIHRNSTEAERIDVYIKEQIRMFRKDIIAFIDNLENKLENDMSHFKENNISKVKQAKDSNDELHKEIKTLCIEVNQQEKHSKKIDSFVTMKQTRSKIANVNDKADSVIQNAEIDNYTFKTKPIQLFGEILKELKSTDIPVLPIVVCYKCGKSGHMSRECPDSMGGGGGGYFGTMSCYNCGKSGHMSRECPESRGGGGHFGRSGGGGSGICYYCGDGSHFRDCPQNKLERGGEQRRGYGSSRGGGCVRDDNGGDDGYTCYNCGESGHFARECHLR